MIRIPKELQQKMGRKAKQYSDEMFKLNPRCYDVPCGNLRRDIDFLLGATLIAEQLVKAVEALRKSIEFGEHAEWAIEESKELQMLDEDARNFLKEHERWLNEK